MPTPPTSAAELIELLKKSGVAAPRKLAALAGQPLPRDPKLAASELVATGVLTRFQADQLLAGRHKGFRLGSYTVLDLLGKGGVGAVYLAEHTGLNRKVALKVLIPGKGADPKRAAETFLNEARAAAALDHPNIVRVFDVTADKGTPFLVMEHIEGESLEKVIARGRVPFAAAAEYAAQAATGLQHAHERGFVHRDVKPANLMLDRHGTIKVLDMGLAHPHATADAPAYPGGSAAEAAGTADFSPPEQAMNLPMDGRADVYSLGATLFALIAGKPPFEGTTAQKLLQHQITTPPALSSLRPEVPPELSAVVARMLEKKPEDRYQTPAEVVAALAPWVLASPRVAAGMGRTRVAQRGSLQATLADIAASAPRRTGSDIVALAVLTEEADPAHASQETGSISGHDTQSAPPLKARPRTAPLPQPAPAPVPVPVAAAAPRSRALVYAAVALAAVAAGALAGWLSLAP
ncbi:serine threonine protein kinase : Putative serine/threonine protein kinase (Fragment) OS=Gemmata sp. Wa1-1 PE=3 SV=1: Pkinase [Gemmataceae bacterium]